MKYHLPLALLCLTASGCEQPYEPISFAVEVEWIHDEHQRIDAYRSLDLSATTYQEQVQKILSDDERIEQIDFRLSTMQSTCIGFVGYPNEGAFTYSAVATTRDPMPAAEIQALLASAFKSAGLTVGPELPEEMHLVVIGRDITTEGNRWAVTWGESLRPIGESWGTPPGDLFP